MIYAECGGMMYLTQAIRSCSDTAREMAGLFQAETARCDRGIAGSIDSLHEGAIHRDL